MNSVRAAASVRRMRECVTLAVAMFIVAVGAAACGRTADEHAAANAAHPCASCHMAEYHSAGHRVTERPTACQVCHFTTSWRSPPVLQHRWPLTGAHEHTRCFACHRGNPPVFQGNSTACVDCHRADYDGSDFAGHSSFPTTCADCHSTRAWAPSIRSAEPTPAFHATTADAGTAPRPTPADRRHRTSRVAPAPAPPAAVPPPETPTQAQPAFEAPTPMHPESRFPIQSGHHAGIACSTCHDQGGTMGRNDTDCLQCHPRSRYDDFHASVRGYPSGRGAPNFCVNCHRHGTRSRN